METGQILFRSFQLLFLPGNRVPFASKIGLERKARKFCLAPFRSKNLLKKGGRLFDQYRNCTQLEGNQAAQKYSKILEDLDIQTTKKAKFVIPRSNQPTNQVWMNDFGVHLCPFSSKKKEEKKKSFLLGSSSFSQRVAAS